MTPKMKLVIFVAALVIGALIGVIKSLIKK